MIQDTTRLYRSQRKYIHPHHFSHFNRSEVKVFLNLFVFRYLSKRSRGKITLEKAIALALTADEKPETKTSEI